MESCGTRSQLQIVLGSSTQQPKILISSAPWELSSFYEGFLKSFSVRLEMQSSLRAPCACPALMPQ